MARLSSIALGALLLIACRSPVDCRPADLSCNGLASLLLYSRVSLVRAAYLTDNVSNLLYSYSIDPTTGQPSLIGSIGTQVLPRGVAVHPAGYVYAANETGGSISIYRILPGYSVSLVTHFNVGGGTPSALAINSAGTLLYVTRQGVSLVNSYWIDASTGLLSSTGFTGTTDATTNQISLHPTLPYAFTGGTGATSYGFLLGANGSFTTIPGAVTATDTFYPLITPNGRYLLISDNGQSRVELFSVSQQNGALTALSPAFFSVGAAAGVSFVDASGTSLYVCIPISNSMRTFPMNSTTGQPSAQTQAFSVSGGPYGLAMDPTNTYLFAAGGTTLYVFKRDSAGTLTQIAQPTPGGAAFNKVAIYSTSNF